MSPTTIESNRKSNRESGTGATTRGSHPAQRTFNTVLRALAEPGLPRRVADLEQGWKLNPAGVSVMLSLLDCDTSIWVSPAFDAETSRSIRFATGANTACSQQLADVVLISHPTELPPLDRFAFGTTLRPDNGATVIVQVSDFESGCPVILTGPGIERTRTFLAANMDSALWKTLIPQRGVFPQGVDLLFFSENAVAAIPRSTRITVAD
jgi:alpha-D-ribose 1-methylphosphonate 5-triphosphate synthase subunit PhnH